MHKTRLAAAGVLALAASLALAGCATAAAPGGDASTPAAPEPTVVTLGTTDASQGHWTVLEELLLEEGIQLEVIPFDSYETPNPALADGSVDLNAFQHIDYLSNHNVATGDDLRVVGPTLVVPLPLYSNKYEKVADIPADSRIAIPNDATNQARALKVLAAAGLLELDPDAAAPTPADITSSKVKVEPVDASQTAPSLNDPQIAGAVVNNNFAKDAEILDQAIFWLDPSDSDSWPYVNIIASRAGEEDKPEFQKVWELYHDPRVTEIVVEESGGTAIIVEEAPATVREWLVEVENQKR